MKKIKYLLILLTILILITGCSSSNESKLLRSVKNTSITENGLKSYRAKVSIVNNDKKINYIVLNKENKDYKLIDGNNEYNYKDTDKYLNILKKVENIKVSDIKIDKIEYKKYDFTIDKEIINSVLKDFNIKVKDNGTGYAYIDQDDHVYIINYVFDDLTINVSYTRLNK